MRVVLHTVQEKGRLHWMKMELHTALSKAEGSGNQRTERVDWARGKYANYRTAVSETFELRPAEL